ncbi:MAG: DUF2135 domain-containing protein [Undibacterium sp.]|nr:DUF2135 domain-containing protein [Undibacterium sp.]
MLKNIFNKSLVVSLMLLTLSLLTFILLTLASAHASAQAPISPLMEIAKGESAIILQSVQSTSEFSGSMLETTVEMVFYNPNSRALEGNLQFPLLPNQHITGFALDINGQLRSAIPVEKAKGRQVFEEIERRGVDPALLEITQGNNFKLRVYPILAHGIRRVQLKYVETLPMHDGQWHYQQPLGFLQAAQKMTVNIAIHGVTNKPSAHIGAQAVDFEAHKDGFQAQIKDPQLAAKATLNLTYQAQQTAQSYLQVKNGETYFLSEIPLPAFPGMTETRALPKVVGLLWDSSGSGGQRAIAAEMRELGVYFKALNNAEIRLIRLRDKAESSERFELVNGNWSALRKALESTVYDGASALFDWKPERDVNEYILVSDGLRNYGKKTFPSLAKNQRLFALNSSPSADSARLAALAEKYRGRLIQVHVDTPGSAAKVLLSEVQNIVDLQAEGATDLEVESFTPDGKWVRIAGKLQASNANIELKLVQGEQTQVIKFVIDSKAPTHTLAADSWASYRLHSLAAEGDLARAQIRRLGQEFGIPTAETSLIVLETLQDYLRYDIVPPAEYVESFNRIKAQYWQTKRLSQQQHLEKILHQFAEKRTWWEKDFSIKKEFPKEEKSIPIAEVHPISPVNPVSMPSSITPINPIVETASKRAQDGMQSVNVSGTRTRIAVSNTNNGSVVLSAAPTAAPMGADYGRSVSVKEGHSQDGAPKMGVALKKWVANAPYLTRMRAANKDDIYRIYLDEKPSYLNSSAFFLDAADLLFEKGQRELALRVLSNLAEMDLENRQILRILAHRLMEAKMSALAIPVLEKVQLLAEEEPQSFRDLALALAANKQYQEAVAQFNQVLLMNWDDRFHDIEIISLAELNSLLANAKNQNMVLDTSTIDPRLIKNMPLDLRVVMNWDADNSDMDLWVTDSNGEKCYFGHPSTAQGGRMTRDVTQGYGPEEFSLRHAKPGKYKVEVNFYGNRQQTIAGATTLSVKLTTKFGTPKAQEKMLSLRLKGAGETVFVGEFEVEGERAGR